MPGGVRALSSQELPEAVLPAVLPTLATVYWVPVLATKNFSSRGCTERSCDSLPLGILRGGMDVGNSEIHGAARLGRGGKRKRAGLLFLAS